MKVLSCFLAILASSIFGAEFRHLQVDPQTGFPQGSVVAPTALVHTKQIFPSMKGDPHAETHDVIRELDKTLKLAHTSLDQVVKLNVYVQDETHVPGILKSLRSHWNGTRKPAISLVKTALSLEEAHLSLDAIAVATSNPASVLLVKPAPEKPTEAAILPLGGHLYISGQASPGGSITEATRKTMDSLRTTLAFLDVDFSSVVSVKAFINPIAGANEAQAEITRFFKDPPPIIFVEWQSVKPPVEIELVVAAGPASAEAPELIEFLTPPGMSSSPLFSRVTKINRGSILYTSGIYGETNESVEKELRQAFLVLKDLLEQAGSDLNHLAKATYYVSTTQSSSLLNKIRPDYLDPKRPPAASKAMVTGVGFKNRTFTFDVIAGCPNKRVAE